jgi:exonuclease III
MMVAAWAALTACNNEYETEPTWQRYTKRIEVDTQYTRAYDADLKWNWEANDALKGYQLAGLNLRNTLTFAQANASFVCEAFEYMSTDPEKFHFIYPAAAEVSDGVLVAVQDGVWRPLSVTTTGEAMIESIPTLTFEVLSAALELRIFAQDKATPVNMAGASLTSETDFVGKWTLQEDMTYTQSLEGKSMEVKDIDSPIVTFNMPDYPEGFAAETLTLKLTDTEGNTMTRTLPEMTFVKGKRTVLNIVFTPDPVDDPEEPVNPDPEEPEVITGTFTCATYNVDGLPSIANSDGPGSSGTNSISAKLATSGWDFIGFQENFEYNSNLQSSMTSAYTFGTHRGSVGVSQLWGSKADTDGLNFATLNTTCSFSKEAYNSFNETYGGLTDGANTCIDKGFRYYLVTMADGVEFDIIVTHMNSGSDSGHISARASQMTQIATYINSIRSNNRPIIIIGDTNCRYTRDDMFQYLYNKLDSDLTYADPWVTYSWNGVYPTLGSASLMVPSKDSSSTFTEQTGEVVDKIIYINNPNSPTQIVADNYYNDEEYAGMADHNPVRATFTYTHTVTK